MDRTNGVTTTGAMSPIGTHHQVANGADLTYGYVNDAIGLRTHVRSGTAHRLRTISYATTTALRSPRLIRCGPRIIATLILRPHRQPYIRNEAGSLYLYTNNLNQYTSPRKTAPAEFPYDLDRSMTYRPVDATTGWAQVWNGETHVETTKGTGV